MFVNISICKLKETLLFFQVHERNVQLAQLQVLHTNVQIIFANPVIRVYPVLG